MPAFPRSHQQRPITRKAAERLRKMPGIKRVLHFIPRIGGGGAENFLLRLMASIQPPGWKHVILTPDVGPFAERAEKLRSLGCQVIDLKEPRLMSARLWWKTWRVMREQRPAIVQTWMHHADLIGGLAAKAAGIKHLVWGVRASEVHRNPKDSRLKTKLFHSALWWTSGLVPSAIITNSAQAREAHVKLGYTAENWFHIPNGVCAERFRPRTSSRRALRQRLEIPESAQVIGFTGRFHEVKDLVTFFRAARCLRLQRTDVHFLLVGGTVADLYPEALAAYQELPQSAQVHFMPFASEPEGVYPAMGVFTLCSRSEAFPNVVLEALACGLPAVTTDAGDCAAMLGDLGIVVPCQDSRRLSEGWEKMLSMSPGGKNHLSAACREHVRETYSVARAAQQFLQLYEQLVASCASNDGAKAKVVTHGTVQSTALP